MSPQKIWRLKTPSLAEQKTLSDALKISLITAQVLINRGVTSAESAQTFLNPKLKDLPNPFLLPDMEKGVRRIIQAIAKKELIAIYGDYDVDGIASSALLSSFFKEIGIAVRVHIPDRIKEGYGLQKEILKKLKKEKVGLVITADCGTKSHEALQAAKEIALDVIVTDHHQVDSQLPPAFAFINPQISPPPTPSHEGRGDNNLLFPPVKKDNNLPSPSTFPSPLVGEGQGEGKELAGCGVAFFLLMALRQKLREEKFFTNGEPNLKQYLDLVALATIGDMAPLTGVNRILVSLGLQELTETKRPGLVALKEIAKLDPEKKMQASDIGFRLGPRINAGGRISQSGLGLNLLLADDLERAQGLAKILDQCNQDRQVMQEKHVKEALVQAGEKENALGFVVASKDWHPGIVGLVASKLTENFYRPSIAFSIEGEFARGSARSISGIHIVEVLEKCAEHIVQFGGHAAAAGLTLRTENLKNFEEHFEKILGQQTNTETFTRSLQIDSELKLSDINEKLLEELEMLTPHGIGNREPLFVAKQVRLNDIRTVGTNHLKLNVTEGQTRMEAICFNWKAELPAEGSKADIAFTPQWNSYQGIKTIQLKIKDVTFF